MAEPDLTAHGVGDGLDIGVGALAVEQGGGNGQLLTGDGSGGAAGQVGVPSLSRPPTGAVTARSPSFWVTRMVVAVVEGPGSRRGRRSSGQQDHPSMGRLAGVDNDLHLGDGIRAVGVVDADVDVQLPGTRLKLLPMSMPLTV